ncbi:MAG: hypothetical protein ABFC74_00860, partial [Rectinema sp.]
GGKTSKTKASGNPGTINLELPGPKILFCTRGEGHLHAQSEDDTLNNYNKTTYNIMLHAGESVFAVDAYRHIDIKGASCIYVASVPTQNSAAVDGNMRRSK